MDGRVRAVRQVQRSGVHGGEGLARGRGDRPGPDCPLLRLRHDVLLEWPEFPIPDPGPLHVIAELKEPGTIPAIQVGVNISHPRRGDLQIRVPAGLTGG